MDGRAQVFLAEDCLNHLIASAELASSMVHPSGIFFSSMEAKDSQPST